MRAPPSRAPRVRSTSRSAPASSTSWPPRRTPASATSIARAWTAPAAAGSPRRTAPTRSSSSPDARHFADTRSSLESPPALVVSSADGLRTVPVPYDRNPDLAFERGRYEWVELKARDGAALYGRLLKPAGFDPAKRHPAIVRVYGGPGVQLVTELLGPRRALRAASREPRLPRLVSRQPRLHGTRPRLRGPTLQGHGPDRARGPARGGRVPEVAGLRGPAAPRHLRLVLRRLPDPLRPDPRPRRLQGRGGGSAGHRLALLRHDLHRALHGRRRRTTPRATRRAHP